MKKIAIIGAGPAGIEAASILASHDCEVQLFEKS
ncbi:MAG: NAD-binding protein, partial [Bacteroidales bacterium]|nr:NAD-binding protein [Bacteroidales bacterium]